MKRLVVFNQVSLDGYFTHNKSDMSWTKQDNDEEINTSTSENAKSDGLLIFGRVTYDLMASFWPTKQAHESFPTVAERMNKRPKIVFSRKLNQVSWNNTKLIKDDLVTAIKNLKKKPGEGLTILGSGQIVSQLATEGFIDEYRLILNPIALGAGRTMFEGIQGILNLRLVSSRVFRNGKIFLIYEPRK